MARSSVYSDVDIELTKQTDGDVQRDNDINAVINSLSNIISTLQGSRRMLPEFAQDLWNLLFEPLDEETARMIGERLIEAIRVWDDRVEISRINIDLDHDANTYNLSLSFRIKPLNVEETVDFVIYSQ